MRLFPANIRLLYIQLTICWQSCWQRSQVCQHAWDKRKIWIAKTCCKHKKSPQPSMRVREFFGAASRNRTGTVLGPGDFKSPASTSSAMAACKYYTRMDSVCQTMRAAGLRFFQSRLCCFPIAVFQKKRYNKYNSSPVQK